MSTSQLYTVIGKEADKDKFEVLARELTWEESKELAMQYESARIVQPHQEEEALRLANEWEKAHVKGRS